MAHLFENIADVKLNLPGVHAQLANDDFFPYLTDGDEKYLIPYLGQDFFDELTTELEDADWVITDLPAELQKVATYLRKASAFYGAYEAFPFLNVNIANIGMVGHQTEGAQPLRQWEYKEVQSQAIRRADEYLDRALVLMEAAPDDYPTWSGDPVFDTGRELLINNATDFRIRGLLSLGDSRRTYLALRPYIKKTEDRYIVDCIGATLLASIKAKLLAGTALTAKEAVLLNTYIYPALAHLAMYTGSPELKLDISQQGIRLASTTDGITSMQPADAAYKEWRQQILGDGQNYLSHGRVYLEANASDFPDYESDAAADQTAQDYHLHDNSASTSSFMI